MTHLVNLLVFLLFLAVSVIVGLGAGFPVHAEGLSSVKSIFTAFGSAGATLTLCCVVYASFRV
ncbi:hypothetical protein [Streptomyces sp. NPDC001194]|uniref:hypothetical protein n=1 Tax=unclassified Streptomyces TaxID=2593676 RepID=UPI0036AA61A4